MIKPAGDAAVTGSADPAPAELTAEEKAKLRAEKYVRSMRARPLTCMASRSTSQSFGLPLCMYMRRINLTVYIHMHARARMHLHHACMCMCAHHAMQRESLVTYARLYRLCQVQGS